MSQPVEQRLHLFSSAIIRMAHSLHRVQKQHGIKCGFTRRLLHSPQINIESSVVSCFEVSVDKMFTGAIGTSAVNGVIVDEEPEEAKRGEEDPIEE